MSSTLSCQLSTRGREQALSALCVVYIEFFSYRVLLLGDCCGDRSLEVSSAHKLILLLLPTSGSPSDPLHLQRVQLSCAGLPAVHCNGTCSKRVNKIRQERRLPSDPCIDIKYNISCFFSIEINISIEAYHSQGISNLIYACV